MVDLETLLGENALTSIAFTIIKKFSTQRPLQSVLAEIFNAIGNDLKIWSEADFVTHVFTNPSLQESHRFVCRRDKKVTLEGSSESLYERLEIKPDIPIFHPKSITKFWELQKRTLPEDKLDTLLTICLPEDQIDKIDGSIWICQLDFARELPLGHFCLCWEREPWLKDSELQHLQHVLWSLAETVAIMLRNHFIIHKYTYLPSFCLEGRNSAALLFADIRNSTSLFEIARLGGEKYMRCVELLLKKWLEYAAKLISEKGLGYIHGFSGDGFMATFGEYAIGTDEQPADQIACVLSLHAAKYLVSGFNQLYARWRKHKNVKMFYYEHNEDVELNLGVGINYGEIYFSYFGRSSSDSLFKGKEKDTVPSFGHLEYTAVGDHVNTAQRLEGIASKLVTEINLHDRGKQFKDKPRISPIVVSQTVAYRLLAILTNAKEEKAEDEILKRRGIVNLKGKGMALPFYEVNPYEINEIECAAQLNNTVHNNYCECLKNPPSIDQYVKALEEELDKLV